MTSQAALWVDLPRRVESAGREFVMPGSAPAVRLARLHADSRTGATVSVVAFPPRWYRPAAGHYLAAEEFVLLRGDLEVNGERFVAGDCGWLPPLITRVDCSSGAGALALAWFSGPADWRDGPGPAGNTVRRATTNRRGLLRGRGDELPGESAVLALPNSSSAEVDCDLLDIAALRWCFVAAGEPLPACWGPVFLRRWS